jgi:hypothetical protein
MWAALHDAISALKCGRGSGAPTRSPTCDSAALWIRLRRRDLSFLHSATFHSRGRSTPLARAPRAA